MVALSKAKSSLAGMGLPQKVATIALALLALIALIAVLSGRGGGGAGSAPTSSSSGFTKATYSDAAATPSGTHAARGSQGAAGASGSAQDGLATVALSDLPVEARKTVALIDAGGPYPYSRDGVVFGNFEHVLPKQARGWYHEYTVKTPGASNRGARRIIEGKDGTLYYTADHYVTFRRVTR